MEHKIIHRDINSLIFAEYNPRQLTKEQHKNLKDSIQRFGLVDPILINKNKDRKNVIIGGHQRVRIAKELKMEDVPVLELDLTYDREKELNIRLNKNMGEWDFDILANMFDVEDLSDYGFTDKELKIFDEEEDVYSRKIEAPVYQVRDKKPEINKLIDNTKVDKLIKKIESSSISEEEKDFLKKASMRHCVFNYSKIADFYAHSDVEMQELMKESALVIIDYNKAIENGFVEMTEYMIGLQKEDE